MAVNEAHLHVLRARIHIQKQEPKSKQQPMFICKEKEKYITTAHNHTSTQPGTQASTNGSEMLISTK